MAGNLCDALEVATLDMLNGRVAGLVTAPLRMRLMTAQGDDTTAGTEANGGTYSPQASAWDASVQSGSGPARTRLSADIPFPGMPACAVVGAELWDSSPTPKRVWRIPAASSKSVNAGDTYVWQVQYAPNQYTELTLD